MEKGTKATNMNGDVRRVSATSPVSQHLRRVETPILIERIRRNDETLRCLQIGPELFSLPDVMDALQRNQSIRSVVFVRLSPKTISEASFANFLECLYHLPLRSVLASDLHLPARFMDHLLHLVEYACGVGVDCQWALEEAENAAAGAAAECEEAPQEGAGARAVEQLAVTASCNRKLLPVLEFFDLSGNALTEAQAVWLGRIIFNVRSTLRRVNASECRLGNSGMRALLRGARNSSRCSGKQSIQTLSLRWNGVTEDDSFGELLDALNDPICQTRVEAQGNYVSAALYRRLVEREERLTALSEEERDLKQL